MSAEGQLMGRWVKGSENDVMQLDIRVGGGDTRALNPTPLTVNFKGLLQGLL